MSQENLGFARPEDQKTLMEMLIWYRENIQNRSFEHNFESFMAEGRKLSKKYRYTPSDVKRIIAEVKAKLH
ncbi:MAG: hypothetical protein HY747_02095 [Elusimicrobia bacterium]|nr:hypothetical protein [Elusimicrobiota bacterium]